MSPPCFVSPATMLESIPSFHSLSQSSHNHSSAVRRSSSSCLLNSSGFSRTSIPGPMECAFLDAGKTCVSSVCAPALSSSTVLSYLRSTPSQSKSRLVRKQLPKAKHKSIDEREEQVDGGTTEQTPERRRRIEDHCWRRSRRRGLWWRDLFRLGAGVLLAVVVEGED